MSRPDAKIQAVPDAAPKATYTREEVLRMLSVTERQLRQWERYNLIRVAQAFSLPDIIALRTLKKLKADRIPADRIRLALVALRARLREIDDPLRELKVIADGKRIRVEIAGQHMEAFSGQLLFNFGDAELRRLLTFPAKSEKRHETRDRKSSAESWFQKGLALERSGAVRDAMQAYETAVNLDPGSAGAWVNLGTMHFNARQFSKAESCYRKAIGVDAHYALAHFNMGNLFDERGDYERALDHYKQAVEIYPQYSDAHYNLALLYQGGGQVMEAVRHWKLYLRLDPGSSWAAIARRELDKLRRSALVRKNGPRRPTGTRLLE
ncbi:MAG: tetratricopeptide repeat protein [Bryobacteraceae bacterium]|nr:tetratricopeptide repeat protein [Bryobacteraceae bacterium]